MNKPDRIPAPVLESVKKFAKHHNLSNVDMLSPSYLKWDSLNGCYFFTHAGVYYGIELDGYLHS